MNELKKSVDELLQKLVASMDRLKLNQLQSEIDELTTISQQPDFWQDNTTAQSVMQRLSSLQTRLEPWQKLHAEAKELQELVNMNDQSLASDLEIQNSKLQDKFVQLSKELQFSKEFDDKNAIVSIYAGAGGTDAQDWAQMLLRMYTRWAEQNDCQVELIEESAGDEAGIKSATLRIRGAFVYGKIQGEHGVHRLVRLSPFNSDNLRQTSFAKVDVMPEIDRPDDLQIDERDLKIDVFRAGGHGGQSVNTTDSAVRVTHIPTGIVVSIQNERSQLQNKETAMTILRSKLAKLQIEQHQKELDKIKGPNQSAEWGNQIRSYVLHPYKQVKDLRTRHESSDPQSVLSGKIDDFITAYLEYNINMPEDTTN